MLQPCNSPFALLAINGFMCYIARMKKTTVASLIDHTLLEPHAGIRSVIMLCAEARKYGFHSVCVNPSYVSVARDELASSDVKVTTVIGFPFGAISAADKAGEAKRAVEGGADELDMVMNIGAARDGRFSNVEQDILAVVQTAWEAGNAAGREILVKVILETCFLDDRTVVTSCECARKAGADFVKTSTGFASPKSLDGTLLPNGASEHHVLLMKNSVGDTMGVKASGGIRTQRNVVRMLEAGATRIGTSSSVNIIETWDESLPVLHWD